jgi:hypothetical protein
MLFVALVMMPSLWLSSALTRYGREGDDPSFSLSYGMLVLGAMWVMIVGSGTGALSIYMAERTEVDGALLQRAATWMAFWVVTGGAGYVLLELAVKFLRSGVKALADSLKRLQCRPDKPAAHDGDDDQPDDCQPPVSNCIDE